MNQHKMQHLIDQALEYQVTSGFTDEIYTKGRVCVSKAFTDNLIELIAIEAAQFSHKDNTEYEYYYYEAEVLDYFGVKNEH